ncbi:NADP-dependent oxidoreductase domain-containing protein, partial [Multifurca ochricompacta]
KALEAGFSHLDTAAIYANEQFIGKATRESGLGREDVWATTKYDDGVVSEEVHSSFQKMNKVKHAGLAKWVSLLFLGDLAPLISRILVRVRARGRSIGVGNFTLDLLQCIVKTGKRVPAVNQEVTQFLLHPYNYASWKDVLEFLPKRGILTEAYGSLASIATFPGGLIDPTLARIAARIGGILAQVIFTWAHSMGGTPDETSTYPSFN